MTSGKQASNNYAPSFNRINDFLVIPSYIILPWYLQNLIMLVCMLTKYRSSHPEVFLKISQNSQENTCARVSFLIKLQAPAYVYQKQPFAGALQLFGKTS